MFYLNVKHEGRFVKKPHFITLTSDKTGG